MKNSILRKIRRRMITVVIFVVITLFAANSFAQFAGGDGTAANPWQVSNVEQLQAVASYLGAAHTDKHFIQTSNIDISEVVNWNPIGTSSFPPRKFQAHYNGNGFEIRGLSRAAGALGYFGLFGTTDTGAILENINLTNVVTHSGQSSGSIVGHANNTIIRNCSVQGSRSYINGNQGGVVGLASGTTSVYRCSANMRFEDRGTAAGGGGIVGHHNATGNVEECFAVVEMGSTRTGSASTGGLVGHLQNGALLNCYVVGSVVTNQPSGSHGGLVGANVGNRPITNCYAVVSIRDDGTGPIGGLVAQGTPDVVRNSYWDSRASRIATSPGGGESRTTQEMTHPYDRETYVGWNFENVWMDDTENVNGGYPVLAYYYASERLDTPIVTIEKIKRDGNQYVKLQWNEIDSANSYKVYVTSDISLPIVNWSLKAHVGGRNFEEAIVQDEPLMFYRVQALAVDPPDGR